jgi:26S proteasome regulatory subunit N5
LQDSTAVATSSLDNALQNLLAFEKKCRLANDFHCLKEVCLHIVRLCRSQNNWTTLNSMLTLISKRRAQNKLAITAIVDETFSYIEQTPTREIKVALIKTLTDICEGKMYVEGESAKLHMMTALMLEEDGDLTGACNAIQDVHVETYGSLSRLEKSEYIWQQTRFNLLNKDYVRAMIQSRKMNRKTIEEPEFQEVKVKFYRLMVEFYSHEKDTWEISQCFYKVRP